MNIIAEQKDKKATGKASTKAKNKYNSLNYDRLYILIPKGKKDEIKKACTEIGCSINSFIKAAIDEKLNK